MARMLPEAVSPASASHALQAPERAASNATLAFYVAGSLSVPGVLIFVVYFRVVNGGQEHLCRLRSLYLTRENPAR